MREKRTGLSLSEVLTKPPRILFIVFAFIFLVISLPLLVWGFWPPRRETVSVPLVSTSDGVSLTEARTIRLEYAPVIRAGESEIVRLWVVPGEAYQADPLYEAYVVIAEARLELPFADVRPTEIVSTPLLPGDSASFYWEVSPREQETLRGTIWLYLRFVPKGAGEETRVTVSAQPLQIRPVSVLKRTGSEARAAGVIGLVIGVLLAIPFLQTIWKKS